MARSVERSGVDILVNNAAQQFLEKGLEDLDEEPLGGRTNGQQT